MVGLFRNSREDVRIAVEALSRYKLRTSLSVLGVVLGVAAVIAMMSVSEGGRREALAQVEGLGLDNLVARSQGVSAYPGAWKGLTTADADRMRSRVPLVERSSPLVSRRWRVKHAHLSADALVLGVRPDFQNILRLAVSRGRFLSAIDERTSAHACVIGASLAQQLFGFRNPVGESIGLDNRYCEVVGVLEERGSRSATATLAWHDVNRAVFMPLPTISGKTLDIVREQPVDEVWVRVSAGERAEELGKIFAHALASTNGDRQFTVIVPRELLAQRQRTQRTFSIVVGSVAVLALVVGGIGIMNIMLTSVVERTREIGVRRTVGATRRDISAQFLIEALLMTVSGGAFGIVLGTIISWAITAFAGWSTLVSPLSVVLGFAVSFLVGLIFGSYPAMRAAALEPVDAMRYE